MILSSPIDDRYFHECFFPTNRFPNLRSHLVLPLIFADMSNICFQCEICCIYNGMQIVWVILSPWTLHITECFFVVFWNIHRRLSVFFHTWSFTISKNDLDPNDNSILSPVMNCCALAPRRGKQRVSPVLSWFFLFKKKSSCVHERKRDWNSCVLAREQTNGCHRSITHYSE